MVAGPQSEHPSSSFFLPEHGTNGSLLDANDFTNINNSFCDSQSAAAGANKNQFNQLSHPGKKPREANAYEGRGVGVTSGSGTQVPVAVARHLSMSN